jgi:hypothetical protein
MFRFILGLLFGAIGGAFGMAYLWWKDEQQRAEANYPPETTPTQ